MVKSDVQRSPTRKISCCNILQRFSNILQIIAKVDYKGNDNKGTLGDYKGNDNKGTLGDYKGNET